MKLPEVIRELNLSGSYNEQCKQYAEMLNNGYVLGIFPEELTGMDTSPDGVWKWSKKTGFINKYKFNVDFNEVLCVLESPLPDGVFIINKHFDYTCTTGERERILARVAPKRFVDVRVNYEFHLIFYAREISRNKVDREISQLIIQSATKYFEPFLKIYEAEDDKHYNSMRASYIPALLRLYRNYMSENKDEHAKRDDMYYFFITMIFDLTFEDAEWFLNQWDKDWDNEERIREMKSIDGSLY